MTQWYSIITLVAGLFGIQQAPPTNVVATPVTLVTRGPAGHNLLQDGRGFKINDIQKSIISEVKTLWESKGRECQLSIVDVPEVATKLRTLRASFSEDQLATLNHWLMLRTGEEVARQV